MPNSSTGPTDDGRDGFTGTWIPPELRQSLPRKPVLAFDRAVAKQQQKQEPQKDPEPEWKCPSSDCRLSFNTEAELTRHQKVKSHWGCLVCKIDYKDQMALSNHIQQVSEQAPCYASDASARLNKFDFAGPSTGPRSPVPGLRSSVPDCFTIYQSHRDSPLSSHFPFHATRASEEAVCLLPNPS